MYIYIQINQIWLLLTPGNIYAYTLRIYTVWLYGRVAFGLPSRHVFFPDSLLGENYSVVWAPSRERRYTHNRIEDIAAEACGYVYSLVSRIRA